MRKLILSSILLLVAVVSASAGEVRQPEGWGDTAVITYPRTHAIFYGSAYDLDRIWDNNICTGSTDGGVEIDMVQEIKPIENCPGEYVVIRRFTLPDGTVVQSLRRLSDLGSVEI